MSPAKAIISAGAVVLTAAALLTPSASATAPCPVDYCTDPSGKYVLEVPPLTSPLLAAYADCVWNAHVDFGDGTSADYVFDAAVGLTGSHVFPTPGTTYTVTVFLSDGHHGQTEEPCPDYPVSAEVRYRTAAEEADEPHPPPAPVDEGGAPPPPPPLEMPPPNAPTQAQEQAPPDIRPASSGAGAYWRRCGGGVRAHLVSCKKGIALARVARKRLTVPGKSKALGFSCRLPRPGSRSILCRRGERAVRASRST